MLHSSGGTAQAPGSGSVSEMPYGGSTSRCVSVIHSPYVEDWHISAAVHAAFCSGDHGAGGDMVGVQGRDSSVRLWQDPTDMPCSPSQGLVAIPVSIFFSGPQQQHFDHYIRFCFVKVKLGLGKGPLPPEAPRGVGRSSLALPWAGME